jgi:hypothetical protein
MSTNPTFPSAPQAFLAGAVAHEANGQRCHPYRPPSTPVGGESWRTAVGEWYGGWDAAALIRSEVST